MNWEHYLRLQTQNPTFLWRMVFAILTAGMVIGFVVQFLPKPFSADSSSLQYVVYTVLQGQDGSDGIAELLAEDVPFEHVLVAIAHLDSEQASAPQMARVLIGTDGTKAPILVELLRSVSLDRPTRELVRLADQQPPVRYANHAIGAYYLQRQDFDAAARRFEAEGQLTEAAISRQFAVDTYGAAGNSDALSRLAKLPEYQPLISPIERLLIAEAERDWRAIFWTIPSLILERFQQGFATALAIVAGLGWFVVALQLGQFRTSTGVRWWLCLLGVGMGVLSIWATHLLNVWQELDWGITSSEELMDGVKFYVLGVGLREEFAKLLLLLPLMPLIVRRRNPLEALVVSACVGLGFAMVENMGYFASSGSVDSMGRFLTANFAHMAMTGLIGLAVARAFWSSREASHAALVFLVVMLAHGVYDATIALPQLADYSIAGMIIFILLSYAFFQEVRQVYKQHRETISLTATFLFVVCTLTSLTFIYLSWRVGFVASATLIVADIVSLSVMVYMYLREMPNSLIR